MRRRSAKTKLTTLALLALLGLALIAAGCGDPTARPVANSGPIGIPGPTVTPPFRALAGDPTATPTLERGVLLPSATPLPVRTATPAPTPTTSIQYTPLPTFGLYYSPPAISVSPVVSNGTHLVYVQDGNLWTVDDAGEDMRRLTDGGDINTNGAIAPDLVWNTLGDRLAYVNKKNELVIVSFGAGAPGPLFFKPTGPNQNPAQPAWSPDGRTLAFTLKPQDLAPAFAGEIWVVDLQSSKPSLQKIDNGFGPTWSPDGKFLAYLTRSGEAETVGPTPTRYTGPTPAGTPLLPPTATAQPGPIKPEGNALAVYTLGTKRSRQLFQTTELPDFPSFDWKITYKPEPSLLTALWWSPDSRFIAFADQNSYLGVVNAGGGSPTMWVGLPGAFGVRQLNWLPAGNGVLFSWNNPSGDDRTFLGLISGLGTLPKVSTGQPDLMTSKDRLTVLPSEHVICSALSPAGDLVAYTDPRLQAMVVVRLDWTVYSLLPGGDCPRWSPDGRYVATTLRNAENMIATLSPELANLRPMIQTKGASGLYWQRPEKLPIDITQLTPMPALPPPPGVTPIRPDQINPPPSGTPAIAVTPVLSPSVRASSRIPTPTIKR